MTKRPKVLRKYKTVIHGQEVEVKVYEEHNRAEYISYSGPFDWGKFIADLQKELEEDDNKEIPGV